MAVFFFEKREAIRNELIDIGRENSLCMFWSCEIMVRVLDRNWIVSFNEKYQVISQYHREESAQGRWAQHLWQVWEVWQYMPHIVSWAHATYASGLCKKTSNDVRSDFLIIYSSYNHQPTPDRHVGRLSSCFHDIQAEDAEFPDMAFLICKSNCSLGGRLRSMFGFSVVKISHLMRHCCDTAEGWESLLHGWLIWMFEQGTWNGTHFEIWGDQTMQIYGNFEGFPLW